MMELVADVRFRFELIIPSSDIDSLRTLMGRIKREVEDNLEDTEVQYNFIKKDVCCMQWDVLMITWTIKDVPLSDMNDRDVYRKVTMYDLDPVLS